MSGDRLARIAARVPWRMTLEERDALVEIAKAARALIDLDPEDVWDDTAEFDALRSALARLDNEEGK